MPFELNKKYFLVGDSHPVENTTENNLLIYSKLPCITLVSTNKQTGTSTPIACVQWASDVAGRPNQSSTLLIPKNEKTADLVGGNDAYVAFARDNSPVDIVITNLINNNGLKEIIKIDILAPTDDGVTTPMDVTDYHDHNGNSTGPGINTINELQSNHSVVVGTDQRVHDAFRNQARLMISAAKDLATPTGTMTMDQESKTGTKPRRLGQSEFFVTVTPQKSSMAAVLMNTDAHTLEWSAERFFVGVYDSPTQRLAYRAGSYVCDSEPAEFGVIHSRGQLELQSHRPRANSDGGTCESCSEDYEEGDGGDDVQDSTESYYPERRAHMSKSVSRGGPILKCASTDPLDRLSQKMKSVPTDSLAEDSLASVSSQAENTRALPRAMLVSNVSADIGNMQHVLGHQTGCQYLHTLRTPVFSVRLGVAPAEMIINNYIPNDFAELLGAWKKYLTDLTVAELTTSILLEQQFKAFSAVEDTKQQIRSGKTAVFEAKECAICMEEKCDAVLLACMHLCMHKRCLESYQSQSSRAATLCPICRGVIQGALTGIVMPDASSSSSADMVVV